MRGAILLLLVCLVYAVISRIRDSTFQNVIVEAIYLPI